MDWFLKQGLERKIVNEYQLAFGTNSSQSLLVLGKSLFIFWMIQFQTITCPLGKMEWKVTCLKEKCTCTRQPDRFFWALKKCPLKNSHCILWMKQVVTAVTELRKVHFVHSEKRFRMTNKHNYWIQLLYEECYKHWTCEVCIIFHIFLSLGLQFSPKNIWAQIRFKSKFSLAKA